MSVTFGNSFAQESYGFRGVVTCLDVDGRTAAVGAVGERTDEPGSLKRPATMLARIEDRVTASDQFYAGEPSFGSTPPDCGDAAFGTPSGAQDWFEFVVNDASP